MPAEVSEATVSSATDKPAATKVFIALSLVICMVIGAVSVVVLSLNQRDVEKQLIEQAAVFDEALEAGRAALAIDDLALAEERLDTAGTLRPDDAALLAARQSLQAVVASRNAFTEGERLAESGELLAARLAFLQVSESDAARFALAQASALSAEQRWLDDTAGTLDDLLSAEDLIGLLATITRARQAFPSPALEQLIFESRAEQALLILSERGAELVAAERFTEVKDLIRRVTTTFALSDSEGSLAVQRVSDLADAERARVTRIREEDNAQRQRAAWQAGMYGTAPSVPTVGNRIPPANSGNPPAVVPREPVAPPVRESCPTFDSGIRASLGSVSVVITEDRYGTRRLSVSFDGAITNTSSGWMRAFLYSYIFYYGDEPENHPGRRARLTSVEGAQQGDWLAPGSIHRLTQWDDPPQNVGSQAPTHIELNVGANLRADNQPNFCKPDGDSYFDSIRVAISY